MLQPGQSPDTEHPRAGTSPALPAGISLGKPPGQQGQVNFSCKETGLAKAACAPMEDVLGDGGGHKQGVFSPGSSTCFPKAMFRVQYRRFWDLCTAQSYPHPPTRGCWQLQKALPYLKGEIKAQKGIRAGKGDGVAGSQQSP